jgi:hypothetical protein
MSFLPRQRLPGGTITGSGVPKNACWYTSPYAKPLDMKTLPANTNQIQTFSCYNT